MNTLFIIQLITAFIVGGGLIALLSLLAERVGSKISGIVIAFPSTIALAFFFLAWTLSSQTVSDMVPTTLIPLGVSVMVPVIYIYSAKLFSRFHISKLIQILASFFVSSLFWLVLSIPVAIFQFSSFVIGVVVYATFAIFSHLLLHRKKYEKPKALIYTTGQKIGRAAFVGFIIVLVVFLGKTLGSFWGGIFSMFPAAFSSS